MPLDSAAEYAAMAKLEPTTKSASASSRRNGSAHPASESSRLRKSSIDAFLPSHTRGSSNMARSSSALPAA
jgi:hypothetical protein